MGAQESKTPALVVGVIVAAIAAVAVGVRYNQRSDVALPLSAVAQAEARPIPASPWQSEIPTGDAVGQGGLALVSDATMGQSATDIGMASDVPNAVPAAAGAEPQAADPMHTMRIDGSTLDAMVDSINAITASLPRDDAKAFQKAVRVLMVASLPIEQLRAQKVAIDKLPPEKLIAGAQRILAGRTPLEVLKMAQARINAELAKRGQGYGQDHGLPTSGLQVVR